MELSTRPAQIVALTVIVAAIFCFLWLAGAWGQDRLMDQPIISDRVVEKTDDLRIVDKDEVQRVSNKTTLRIQKLENRVTELEHELRKLKAQVEGG